jgi:antitoxin CcdA
MTARRAADIALTATLLDEAEALNVDVAQAAEDGLARAVKAEKERLWRIENAKAIEAANAYVEKHGLPLARFRQF